ncbi:MAG: hypothetical protein ABH879_05075 [archaeon]
MMYSPIDPTELSLGFINSVIGDIRSAGLTNRVDLSPRYINSNIAGLRNAGVTTQSHGQYIICRHNLSNSHRQGEDLTVSYAPHNETVVNGEIYTQDGVIENARLKQIDQVSYIRFNDTLLNRRENHDVNQPFPVIVLHGKTLDTLGSYCDDPDALDLGVSSDEAAYYLQMNLICDVDMVNRQGYARSCFFFPQEVGPEIVKRIEEDRDELFNLLRIGFSDPDHMFLHRGREEIRTDEVKLIDYVLEQLQGRNIFIGEYDIEGGKPLPEMTPVSQYTREEIQELIEASGLSLEAITKEVESGQIDLDLDEHINTIEMRHSLQF